MKTLIHTLFFFLLIQQICFTQGTWTKIGDMPEIRYAHSADEINGKVYIAGGYNTEQGPYPATMLIYNRTSSTWTTTPLPGNLVRAWHTSCVVAQFILIVDNIAIAWNTKRSIYVQY
jgi:hypothetical protein